MKSKQAAISTKIIVIAIVAYAAVEWMTLHRQVQTAQMLLTQLEDKAAVVSQENERLRYEVEHIHDEAVMARLARQKLGLAAPDELIFIDISSQTGG